MIGVPGEQATSDSPAQGHSQDRGSYSIGLVAICPKFRMLPNIRESYRLRPKPRSGLGLFLGRLLPGHGQRLGRRRVLSGGSAESAGALYLGTGDRARTPCP